ncbi:SHOCT domain-containing protein [bacterium]|nr:SHOCT domain-containing protein [bacterium]
MMWEWGPGAGWTMLWMTLFWGGTIFLIIWGVRQPMGRSRQSGSRALEILEERYAQGEIDREEFESRRQDLRGMIADHEARPLPCRVFSFRLREVPPLSTSGERILSYCVGKRRFSHLALCWSCGSPDRGGRPTAVG